MLFQEPRVDVGPASNHLESSNCLDCTLNRLQTVEIRSLEGSRPELLFIQLLLAHSPSLEKITITPSRASDLQKRLDIANRYTWHAGCMALTWPSWSRGNTTLMVSDAHRA
ncbi:hypothetical protein L1887_18493 [Cichorium endivia]|nr:hypothetical protein L1887_18493 [Cichorium endivia]